MSGEIRNKGAVFLFQSVNTAQDFGIEIHQPEPENVLLFFDRLVKLQQLGKHAVAPGRVDQPARTQGVFLLCGVMHGHSVQLIASADIDSGHSAIDRLYPVLYVALPHVAIECEAIYFGKRVTVASPELRLQCKYDRRDGRCRA